MTKRYYSVVFMQGDEAYDVIDIINRLNVDSGISYLAQWDFGEENIWSAEINGDTYNKIPEYPNQHYYFDGHYIMTWNNYDGGSVGLYASYESEAE